MMNKAAQYCRGLVSSLSERLRHGECDVDTLVTQAREKIAHAGDLTQNGIESVIAAVEHDPKEFACSYEESHEGESGNVFMWVIKESLWQGLAGATDKVQLEWREVFQGLNHHGVYHGGEMVGLGNLICEKYHYHLAVYTPDVLPRYLKCGRGRFQRRPFES